MSAGNNVYSTNRLNGKDSNGNVKTTLPALFLTDYQNATKFKELFYCDEVWIQKDSENKSIINGLVEENGSNLSMRDVKRKGNLRIRKDNKNYVVLNDAGLNTYAKIQTELIGENAYSNYIKFTHNIQSAFYSPSREYGVYITIKNPYPDNTIVAENIKYSLTNIIASNEKTTLEQVIASQFAPADFAKGNRLFVTPYIINDEGEKKYAEFVLTIKASLISVIIKKVDSINTKPTSEELEAYMDGDQYDQMLQLTKNATAQETGIYIYKDKELTEKLESSWYNLVSFTKAGNYTANKLGAYNGVKACILVNGNSSVTTWSEGAWVDDTYKVRIWIDPEFVLTESGSVTMLSYTLYIDNATLTPATDLIISVYTRKNNENVSLIYKHEISQVDAKSKYTQYTFKFSGSTDTASGINNINLVCNKMYDPFVIITPYWIPIPQPNL